MKKATSSGISAAISLSIDTLFSALVETAFYDNCNIRPMDKSRGHTDKIQDANKERGLSKQGAVVGENSGDEVRCN